MSKTTRLGLGLALAVFAHPVAGQAQAPAPGATAPRTSPAAPEYALTDRIPMPGDTGWDYLTFDGPSHRLYVSRGDRVLAIDSNSRKVVGEIAPTAGVHGIALAPGLDRAFTSNGRSSSVTVFSPSNLAVVGEVKGTGENPDAILYDSASGRVFTFNGRGKSATAINAKTLAIEGTVPLGGKPEGPAADGAGRIFVNIEDTNTLAVLDSRTLTVTARWPLAPCDEPTGLSLDAAHKRLFVGCHNKLMMVVDSSTGRIVTSLPIGEGVDGTAFDPGTGLAYASNGDGTLTVVHEDSADSFRVVQNVATQRGARTLALDPATHKIYLVTAQFGPPPSPTAERPNPRPPMLPGTAVVLIVSPKG